MAERILIVDDDPVQRRDLCRILEPVAAALGFAIVAAGTADEALAVLAGPDGEGIAAVIVDPGAAGPGSMDTIGAIGAAAALRPVIVQTEQDSAHAALRAGGTDLVVKPASAGQFEAAIRNALKVNALESEIYRIGRRPPGSFGLPDIVARSAAMQRVVALGERAAGSNIPIVIEGEPGAGKELVARAIHGSSARSAGPFVPVNCGAIPESLVEPTLFGDAGSSPAGAAAGNPGSIHDAQGGTLFLDDVGALSPQAQLALLRTLQAGDLEVAGSRRPAGAGIRLISATSRSMIDLVRQGRFREDLYYRLNVFPVPVPPLRERTDDIPLLVDYFLLRFSGEENASIDGVTPAAMALLSAYDWPGNVREFERAMFRAVLQCGSGDLDVDHFPQITAQSGLAVSPLRPAEPRRLRRAQEATGRVAAPGSASVSLFEPMPARLPDAIPVLSENGDVRPLEEVEADLIRFALEHYRGRMSEVARRLKIGRSTLYRRMKELQLAAAE
ncbi:sigma-54 dependent transcriptional regulator [Microbaculum marinum]|uniref:DNA-binding transcriptional regulator NtrC n=1 Tax=Microbaculum marinum TaxID=1764581 RepID=A0AAW9RXX2_9HYPH